MMGNTSLIQTALLVALIVAFGFVATGRAPAGEPPRHQVIEVVGSDASSQFVPLGVGKSVVIDLPRDIKDVLVADPKVANAVIRSSRRAYIIGVKVGQTNVFFFDADGQQIAGLDIAVTRDLNGLREAIRQALPTLDVHVEGLGDGIVLFGNVSSPVEAQQAFDIASRLVDDSKKVVNGITIHGRDQVMLKVTVAEVQRDVIKQLGIDLRPPRRSRLRLGGARLQQLQPVPGLRSGAGCGNHITSTWQSINTTLRAMERAGVIRTLAEPNLTAISGESATFLAGGEFPIPAGYTCTPPPSWVRPETASTRSHGRNSASVLNFPPVVMSEGRISLKVMTEVSELSTENQLTLVQSTGSPSSAPRTTRP